MTASSGGIMRIPRQFFSGLFASVALSIGCSQPGPGPSTSAASSDTLAAPTQLSPANGSVFNEYPRRTVATWTEVPDAASYTIEVDHLNCGGPEQWCGGVERSE